MHQTAELLRIESLADRIDKQHSHRPPRAREERRHSRRERDFVGLATGSKLPIGMAERLVRTSSGPPLSEFPATEHGLPTLRVAESAVGMSQHAAFTPLVLHAPSGELATTPGTLPSNPVSVLLGPGGQLGQGSEPASGLHYIPAYAPQQQAGLTQILMPDVHTAHAHWPMVAAQPATQHGIPPLPSPLQASSTTLASSHGGSTSDICSKPRDEPLSYRRKSNPEMDTSTGSSTSSSRLIMPSTLDRLHTYPGHRSAFSDHQSQSSRSRSTDDSVRQHIAATQLSPGEQSLPYHLNFKHSHGITCSNTVTASPCRNCLLFLTPQN